jgi:hypothetical protein
MCDVKEVARVVHGNLMTLGCSQSEPGLFTVLITVIHHKSVSTHASYDLSICWLNLSAGYFLCYVVGFEATLVHWYTWSGYSKNSAGALSLTAASYGPTFAVVVEPLLKHLSHSEQLAEISN